MSLIPTRVAGIPCTADVHSYRAVPGSFNYFAASDVDYYGYDEADYTICDRRGRPAPWLERKMSEKDEETVLQDIRNAYEE